MLGFFPSKAKLWAALGGLVLLSLIAVRVDAWRDANRDIELKTLQARHEAIQKKREIDHETELQSDDDLIRRLSR